MKEETLKLIIATITLAQEITVNKLANDTMITKRRLYDVLPVLEEVGLITRPKRGLIKWVIDDSYMEPTNVYTSESRTLRVFTGGAITAVRRLGVQGLEIEQTANTFTVEVKQ